MRLPWKRREQWQERLGRNKTILWEKLREALASVVPITVIVLILSFTVAPIPTETLLAFLIGAVMVILGIGLFSLGADTAMTPIGERVGAAMTRSRKLWVVAAVGFLIGVIVTVSGRISRCWPSRCPVCPTPRWWALWPWAWAFFW